MNRRKVFLWFFLLIGGGLGAFYVFHLKLYPAAIVNGRVVSARLFRAQTLAAYQYYRTVFQASLKEGERLEEERLAREVERGVLDKLIQDALIRAELRAYMKAELAQVVDGRVEGTNFRNKEVEENAEKLFGLDLERFKKLVLVPQAERELLEERFASAAAAQRFEDWLRDARREASVIVFAHRLRWDKEKTEVAAR